MSIIFMKNDLTRMHSSRMRTVRCSSYGGCLPMGCLSAPLLTESQTPVKTQPCRNYVADGKYSIIFFSYLGSLESILSSLSQTSRTTQGKCRRESQLCHCKFWEEYPAYREIKRKIPWRWVCSGLGCVCYPDGTVSLLSWGARENNCVRNIEWSRWNNFSSNIFHTLSLADPRCL